MRIFQQLFCLILLILASSYVLAIRRPSLKKQTLHINSSSNESHEKPVIIFDLVNVLFKESSLGFAQKIGYATLTSYAITHWKNPGHRCLDMLNAMSTHHVEKPQTRVTINNRTMPQCIVELQEGKKTCTQALKDILHAIERLDKENFFSSPKEKNLMLTIMNLMLDPTVICHVTEPIKPMIALAQKLKHQGYKLYLFANIPDEFYTELQKKYPDIIALFNGTIISSQEKVVKPDKLIFEQLFTAHNLKAENCILIDNTQETIDAANTLGMRTILFDKINNMTNNLKKYGVAV